jgi:hypothetical protein
MRGLPFRKITPELIGSSCEEARWSGRPRTRLTTVRVRSSVRDAARLPRRKSPRKTTFAGGDEAATTPFRRPSITIFRRLATASVVTATVLAGAALLSGWATVALAGGSNWGG